MTQKKEKTTSQKYLQSNAYERRYRSAAAHRHISLTYHSEKWSTLMALQNDANRNHIRFPLEQVIVLETTGSDHVSSPNCSIVCLDILSKKL